MVSAPKFARQPAGPVTHSARGARARRRPQIPQPELNSGENIMQGRKHLTTLRTRRTSSGRRALFRVRRVAGTRGASTIPPPPCVANYASQVPHSPCFVSSLFKSECLPTWVSPSRLDLTCLLRSAVDTGVGWGSVGCSGALVGVCLRFLLIDVVL